MLRVFSTSAVLLVTLSAVARAEVTLSIDNGRVNLVAKNATVPQILAEWAKVGGTKIVNAERLSGPPVTLELKDVSEETALGTLLRSASGYLVIPQTNPAASVSRFNRILIMPTSTAPRPAPAPSAQSPAFPQPFPSAPPPFPQPFSPQGSPNAPAAPDDQQQDVDAGQRDQPAAPVQRGPVFQTFPMPQPAQQQPAPQQTAPSPPAASPTLVVPPGVSTPGMLVPSPPSTQPGQGAPQQSPLQPRGA